MSRLKDSRANIRDRLSNQTYDVLIIGGGIHGAAFAHLASLNGLKVALAEASDYSAETSSRSSKMIHGGLRYLEFGDLRQVLEGVKAREEQLIYAKHLVHKQEFLLPLKQGRIFEKLKINLGLSIYDLFVKRKNAKHYWQAASKLDWLNPYYQNLAGGFIYQDAITQDSRQVIEHIIAARELGADCLNYLNVNSIETEQAIVYDQVEAKEFKIKAKYFINCAGPFTNLLLKTSGIQPKIELRFSQGIHLVYDYQWNNPALLVPRTEKSGVYWLLPNIGGTMLGTTELELDSAVANPSASKTEINNLRLDLAKDLIRHPLNEIEPHYVFAGIRSLPARSKSSTRELSRKHIWINHNNIYSLYGGKYTTAAWTITEPLKTIAAKLDIKLAKNIFNNFILPGSEKLETNITEFYSKSINYSVTDAQLNYTAEILGSRAIGIYDYDNFQSKISDNLCSGLVKKICQEEQVVYLADLLKRRLNLQYQKSAIENLLFFDKLKSQYTWLDYEAEKLSEFEELNAMKKLISN